MPEPGNIYSQINIKWFYFEPWQSLIEYNLFISMPQRGYEAHLAKGTLLPAIETFLPVYCPVLWLYRLGARYKILSMLRTPARAIEPTAPESLSTQLGVE
jgi:hypothetical protein